MMIFDELFIKSIADDPVQHIVGIVDRVMAHHDEDDGQGWTQQEYRALLEGLSLLVSVVESFELPITDDIPVLSGDLQDDSTKMNDFLLRVRSMYQGEAANIRLQRMISHYKASLDSSFFYEFSKGDLNRIQVLINELREQISRAELIEADHRRRLLKRLEMLQSELHKRMSDLDRFWGLVGDAGVVLGKLGEDAKPIVQRIKEIADIVWRTQSRAEELPSDAPTPLLRNDEDD